LLLRGSRDFDRLAAYEDFVHAVLHRRNRTRQTRLAEELAVMTPLTQTPLITHTHRRVRVSRGSLIRVLHKVYSVPTSLIGHYVNVHIHEWHLDVYYQSQLVLSVPRLLGPQQCRINYRHVIDSLLRKPGGFRDYRYRDDLFPSLVFRQAWEQLNRWHTPRKADITYLRILRLAARHLEVDVATILQTLLNSSEAWDDTTVERLLHSEPQPVPQLTCVPVNLRGYDQLLTEVAYAA
jgi:hypothetical protein